MFITQNEIIYRLPIAKTFDISKLAQYTDVVIRKYLKPRLGLEFYTEIEADRISLGAGSPFTVYDNITAYNQGDTVIYNNIAFECIATPPAAGFNPYQVLYWAYYAPFTTAKYRELWLSGGLFDFVASAVLLESLPFISMNVQATGVVRTGGEFGDSVPFSDVERLMKKTAETVESGWQQTDYYLRLVDSALSINNPTLYKKYQGNAKKGNAKFGIII